MLPKVSNTRAFYADLRPSLTFPPHPAGSHGFLTPYRHREGRLQSSRCVIPTFHIPVPLLALPLPWLCASCRPVLLRVNGGAACTSHRRRAHRPTVMNHILPNLSREAHTTLTPRSPPHSPLSPAPPPSLLPQQLHAASAAPNRARDDSASGKAGSPAATRRESFRSYVNGERSGVPG